LEKAVSDTLPNSIKDLETIIKRVSGGESFEDIIL
jgi:hypothetical protein